MLSTPPRKIVAPGADTVGPAQLADHTYRRAITSDINQHILQTTPFGDDQGGIDRSNPGRGTTTRLQGLHIAAQIERDRNQRWTAQITAADEGEGVAEPERKVATLPIRHGHTAVVGLVENNSSL